jgi:hypothetical protein
MKLLIQQGKTSKLLRVFIQDSSQTDGRGLTGLAFNSGSLTMYYIKEGDASATAVTLASATVGTWTSGGFKEIDATNMPGWYELGAPNAMIASSASVGAHLKGATNMAPVAIEIQLVPWNPDDGVRMGMTALPNAAANAAGGLPISAAGALDMDDIGADVDTIETRVVLALPAFAPQAAGGLVTSIAGSLDLDEMNTDIEAIETRTTLALPAFAPQAAGGLITSIAGSLDLDEMNADVENIESVLTAAQAEPGAVPAANASVLAKLAWLFVLAKNKRTQDGTTETVFKDDSATALATAAKADSGAVFTRSKFA